MGFEKALGLKSEPVERESLQKWTRAKMYSMTVVAMGFEKASGLKSAPVEQESLRA